MILTGLNSDLYYSDNPIFITFSNIPIDTKYIEIFPMTTTLIVGSGINPLRLYVFNRPTITLDISSMVKTSLPNEPQNTDYTTLTPTPVSANWRKINFVITRVTKTGERVPFTNISKTFIKGGELTYKSNQTTSVNRLLAPTSKIPQWGGFPVDYYYFNSSKQLMKSNRISENIREIRKVKGCDPLYLKFRNLQGGYSYWLFENWNSKVKNNNYGTINKRNRVFDLGNEAEITIEAISKVPKRFYKLIENLILSNEIYIYRKGNESTGNKPSQLANSYPSQWESVISNNNNISQNLFNENEKVKLNFELNHRLNPSALWSNS